MKSQLLHMMADEELIPITILTGFLGSGKTTLLNALLAHPQMRDTGIIVNEFGSIGLDHLFVKSSIDNIILLDDGCLCCAVLESFRDTMLDLYKRRDDRDVPPFARVIVETTGMADPTAVVQALLTDAALTSRYRLTNVVTTVDAVLGEGELTRYVETRRQVAMADRLVITKTDKTAGVAPTALLERLRSLNPTAFIHPQGASSLSPEDAFMPLLAGEKASTSPAESSGHAHNHRNGGHEHSDIRSDSLVLAAPVCLADLNRWIAFTRQAFGEALLRCKGIVWVIEFDCPVVVQGVQGLYAELDKLSRWPDSDHRSRLVCISEGLTPGAVLASMDLLQREAVHPNPAAISQASTGE